ncbi:hypothetical protein [Owenweeksia hongkongensis]|uniref:hypothetical protein n=1 Tax=Owenweeksia hongkongensis TaxID=253245 RepID=UPI003A91AC31
MRFKNSLLLSFFLVASLLQAQSIPPPFLSDSSYVFASKMQYKDMVMQGYLAVQYTDACNFRASVNTTMGSTLLDLEWKDGVCTEHYVMDKLDNRFILNALKSDFELLFLQTLQKGKWKQDSIKKVSGHKYYLTFENDKLQQVDNKNWLGKLRRSLLFDYKNDDTQLKSIQLKHHNFALLLELTPLD